MTELIVAIDVESQKQAQAIVDELLPEVTFFKVGSVLFTRYGPSIIDYITKKGGKVFLDLKFHDIPHTVLRAVEYATAFKVFMLSVHTQGGKAMLEAAVCAAQDAAQRVRVPKPYIVGVTVLTSETLDNVEQEVLRRAFIAKEAGLDGVVCSALEAAAVRKLCGSNFLIVTPGIRPHGSPTHDQKRVASPQEAAKAGADYIVVGRPIIESDNIKKAAIATLQELFQKLPA